MCKQFWYRYPHLSSVNHLFLQPNVSHDWTLCHGQLVIHKLYNCGTHYALVISQKLSNSSSKHSFTIAGAFCLSFFRQNFKIVVVLWFDLGAFFRPSFMAVFNFMPGSTVHCSSSFISTHFLISAGNQHFIF